MKKRIILASSSPRRKKLLEQIGLKFKIMPSDYEEDMSLGMGHKTLAETLAYGKAKDVADKVKKGIVIGVDTFIVFKNQRLGKPKNEKDAVRILKLISGQEIKIYSGLAIIDKYKNKKILDHEITKINFKKLTDSEIKKYLKTKEPLDKAGAFGIQGIGSVFVEKLNGCYSNVVGLSLPCLYRNLKKLKIDIF